MVESCENINSRLIIEENPGAGDRIIVDKERKLRF